MYLSGDRQWQDQLSSGERRSPFSEESDPDADEKTIAPCHLPASRGGRRQAGRSKQR
jgi:hypothetical protein